jgi:acyl phosphate:glycerol-3-phosphate acyltransferase
MMSLAAVALAAYLLGSISFSYLIVRYLAGQDIRLLGSGNAGATNVLRTTGKKAGILTLVLDVGKGVAAVSAARLVDSSPLTPLVAGLAVVVGHCYPIFHGFRGGKGVATAAGVAAVLAPLPLLLALLAFVLVVWRTRYVAIGSVAAAATTPALAWAFGRLGWTAAPTRGTILALAAIAALVAWKHRVNLHRLLARTEARLSDPAAEPRRRL